MAELVGSIIAIVGAVGGDGKGNGLSWRPVVMILIGLAKIADIAADWVLVGKLLGGDYCLDEVCGEGMLGKTGNMTNQSHTHNLVPNADGHGHVYKINHTHLVQSDGEPVDKVQGLETLTDFAIAAAVLGTFIELFGLVLTYKADGGDINSIFQKANLEKRPTRLPFHFTPLLRRPSDGCDNHLPSGQRAVRYHRVGRAFFEHRLLVARDRGRIQRVCEFRRGSCRDSRRVESR